MWTCVGVSHLNKAGALHQINARQVGIIIEIRFIICKTCSSVQSVTKIDLYLQAVEPTPKKNAPRLELL